LIHTAQIFTWILILHSEAYNENTRKKPLLMPSSLQVVNQKDISVTRQAGNRYQYYFDSDKLFHKVCIYDLVKVVEMPLSSFALLSIAAVLNKWSEVLFISRATCKEQVGFPALDGALKPHFIISCN
jgi:hypothetical protein